jgi:hypothetical protein
MQNLKSFFIWLVFAEKQGEWQRSEWICRKHLE